MIEVKQAVDELARAFEEFKAANDSRLAELEAKGSVDPLVAEKVDRVSLAISDIEAKMRELAARAARPEIGASRGDEHKAALDRYIRTGVLEEQWSAKSITTTTGADGGFALPKIIDPTIINRVKDISPVRSVARVVTASSRDFRVLVNRDNSGMSGWVGETAARPETNSPQFFEVALPSGEVYANIGVTPVAISDLAMDVAAFVSERIEIEFAQAEGAAFVSGNGANRPQGFVSKGAPVTAGDDTRAAGVLQYIPGGSASALPTTFDPLINMVGALKAAHRSEAVWMMRKTVMASLRTIKSSDGNYLWQPSLAAGMPSTLLGFPVVEAEDMPAVAANAFPVALGNFRAGYTIADLGAPAAIRDPFSNKPFVMFYAIKRVAGDVTDSEAIKLLRISTT